MIHPDAAPALQAWYAIARAANWGSPHDVKRQFATASVVSDDRVVFNIGGNRYRLVCRINYASRTVFIRFIGTHGEYDRIDAASI
jgi:mRNA interferase HigB